MNRVKYLDGKYSTWEETMEDFNETLKLKKAEEAYKAHLHYLQNGFPDKTPTYQLPANNQASNSFQVSNSFQPTNYQEPQINHSNQFLSESFPNFSQYNNQINPYQQQQQQQQQLQPQYQQQPQQQSFGSSFSNNSSFSQFDNSSFNNSSFNINQFMPGQNLLNVNQNDLQFGQFNTNNQFQMNPFMNSQNHQSMLGTSFSVPKSSFSLNSRYSLKSAAMFPHSYNRIDNTILEENPNF